MYDINLILHLIRYYNNIADLENQVINCDVASVAARLRGLRLGNSLQDQLKMKHCVKIPRSAGKIKPFPRMKDELGSGYTYKASKFMLCNKISISRFHPKRRIRTEICYYLQSTIVCWIPLSAVLNHSIKI
jgi:hypothetical protein